MRVIGMDIHRTFAEAVMIDGDKLIRLGRVTMSRDHLSAIAGRLTQEDHIVIEATGNAQAVAEAIAPFVGRVVIAQSEASASHCQGANQNGRHRRDRARSFVRQRILARGVGARPADHEPAPPSDPAQPGRAPTSPVENNDAGNLACPSRAAMPTCEYIGPERLRGCWRRFCRTMRAPRSNGIYANMID